MKLPGFPVAKPGETFTSLVARHLTRGAIPMSLHLRLLRLSLQWANSIIPYDLRPFASLMPAGHPWEEAPEVIAKDHTLVPLFLHFANPKRATATLNNIISGTSKRPTGSLGIANSIPSNRYSAARFCPDCVAHDLKAFGFSVLRREHQPVFVTMCAKHARPLHFNCLRCRNNRKAIGMWQMAGHCKCYQPDTPPLLEADLDPKIKEASLWLSQQVATILAAPDITPSVPVAANLLAALKNNGFVVAQGGLDLASMTDALIDRFSEPFLRQLGLGSWCDRIGQRPNRVLVAGVIEGRTIPPVLRALLLTRLVTNDVASLWSPVAHEVAPRRTYVAYGYARRSRNSETHLDKEIIISAISAAKERITIAARRLGIETYILAAEVRHHGICLSLPQATIERLGAKRIAAVRKALVQGISKVEIQKCYDISAWAIRRIELDQPGLSDAHRKATSRLHLRKNRTMLLSFFRDNPGKSRHAFRTHHVGAYEFLRRYDSDWLQAHFPKPVHPSKKSSQKAFEEPRRTGSNSIKL